MPFASCFFESVDPTIRYIGMTSAKANRRNESKSDDLGTSLARGPEPPTPSLRSRPHVGPCLRHAPQTFFGGPGARSLAPRVSVVDYEVSYSSVANIMVLPKSACGSPQEKECHERGPIDDLIFIQIGIDTTYRHRLIANPNTNSNISSPVDNP